MQKTVIRKMTEIEEIKKLYPEERIRRLKEIEGERRREIEEAETLIRESMREISEASESRLVPIKQVTARDISQLVTADEKRIFRTARFQEESPRLEGAAASEMQEDKQSLEEVAGQEAQEKMQQSGKPLYAKALEDAKARVDYSARPERQDVYRSDKAGFQEEARQMYEQGKAASGEISGSYERRKEKEEKRRAEFF